HKKLPNENAGNVETLYGQKWENWSINLREGERGLPAGSSLPELISNWVSKQALAHKEKYKELPTKDSDVLINYPDLDWKTIDHALLNNKGIFRMSLD